MCGFALKTNLAPAETTPLFPREELPGLSSVVYASLQFSKLGNA